MVLCVEKLASRLEELYGRYNRRDLVTPDPLQFLYDYDTAEDREIAALFASSLAYGRVAMILRSVERVLAPMGRSPRSFVIEGEEKRWRQTYAGFKHRFTGEEDVVALLSGVKSVISRWGSLENCFCEARRPEGNLADGLAGLVESLEAGRGNSLLASPGRGSACKRHFLFLRWMVRRDAVDPGGWTKIAPSKLVIPLDTHMYHICTAFGFTCRKSADLKTAMEITQAFQSMRPDDPARYDFALTRFGIRDDMTYRQLMEECER